MRINRKLLALMIINIGVHVVVLYVGSELVYRFHIVPDILVKR